MRADTDDSRHAPTRDIPVPAFLGDVAQLHLTPQGRPTPMPAIDDVAGRRAGVAAADADARVAERHAGTAMARVFSPGPEGAARSPRRVTAPGAARRRP